MNASLDRKGAWLAALGCVVVAADVWRVKQDLGEHPASTATPSVRDAQASPADEDRLLQGILKSETVALNEALLRFSLVPEHIQASPRPLEPEERGRASERIFQKVPEGISIQRRALRVQVQRDYDTLFAKLQLPPAQLEQVKDLLTTKLGLHVNDRPAIDRQIAALLGKEKGSTYAVYAESLPFWTWLRQDMDLYLQDSGIERLSEEQAWALAAHYSDAVESARKQRAGNIGNHYANALAAQGHSILTPTQRASFEERAEWDAKAAAVRKRIADELERIPDAKNSPR